MLGRMSQGLMVLLGGKEGTSSALSTFLFLGILALIFGVLWLLWNRQGQDSFFEKREADLVKPKPRSPHGPRHDELAEARYPKKDPVLQLPGIQIEGKPHEILGISARATAEEVQKAYRDLMKRYHPDKVGAAGTKIAEALNRAKSSMLENLKKKTP